MAQTDEERRREHAEKQAKADRAKELSRRAELKKVQEAAQKRTAPGSVYSV